MDLVVSEHYLVNPAHTGDDPKTAWGLFLYLRSGSDAAPVFTKIVDSEPSVLGNPFRGVHIKRTNKRGGPLGPRTRKARIAFVDLDGDMDQDMVLWTAAFGGTGISVEVPEYWENIGSKTEPVFAKYVNSSTCLIFLFFLFSYFLTFRPQPRRGVGLPGPSPQVRLSF